MGRHAFVIMPFHRDLDLLHSRTIKPALAQLGLVAKRYDDTPKAGAVLDEMRHSIDHAHLVVAVVTGKNPHVFFELGITLARGKPCVLLAESADDVPDFLEHLPHVIYGGDADMAFKGLIERIGAIMRGATDDGGARS